MVRFGPDLGHSSLNIRKITGRSDMYPEPVVQCNFLYVLNVLEAVAPGPCSGRRLSTHSRRSRLPHQTDIWLFVPGFKAS